MDVPKKLDVLGNVVDVIWDELNLTWIGWIEKGLTFSQTAQDCSVPGTPKVNEFFLADGVQQAFPM